MKLRNKKTGEIITNLIAQVGEGSHYDSIAALSAEREDYVPAEPLIEDKKIRKAVRAWAEVIGNKDNLVISKNMEYHDCCIYDGRLGMGGLIDLGIDLDIDENSYTLAELCGEGDD